jgi:hypothetical protein
MLKENTELRDRIETDVRKALGMATAEAVE